MNCDTFVQFCGRDARAFLPLHPNQSNCGHLQICCSFHVNETFLSSLQNLWVFHCIQRFHWCLSSLGMGSSFPKVKVNRTNCLRNELPQTLSAKIQQSIKWSMGTATIQLHWIIPVACSNSKLMHHNLAMFLTKHHPKSFKCLNCPFHHWPLWIVHWMNNVSHRRWKTSWQTNSFNWNSIWMQSKMRCIIIHFVNPICVSRMITFLLWHWLLKCIMLTFVVPSPQQPIPKVLCSWVVILHLRLPLQLSALHGHMFAKEGVEFFHWKWMLCQQTKHLPMIWVVKFVKFVCPPHCLIVISNLSLF